VSPNSEGEGLANTRKRLQELYGEQQQFELRNATPAGGAIAKVRLPFHMAPLPEAEVQPAW
jgi:LytS/YehU family sensor histidine kinase